MRDAPETRHSLLARLHGSESEVAWVEFLHLYEPAIYRFARRQGLQDADAHEVVQEVLLNVRSLASNPQNAKKEKFRAWLSAVTRNRVIDLIRKRARKENAMVQLSNRTSDPEESFRFEVRHQMFMIASKVVQKKVSPNQWQAFWQSTVDGRLTADIAADLGMTTKAVRQAKCRVLHRLRQELDELL